MENAIQIYTYNGQDIEFDLSTKSVMINATEMARPFNKKVVEFLSNKETKLFITECLLSGNSHFINVKSEKDLVMSRKKSGTWMHRILALKFAAWLNPRFQLWVYATIEKVLYGAAQAIEQQQRERAKLMNEINLIAQKLRNDNPDFALYEKLQTRARQMGYQLGKTSKNQLELFMIQES